MLEGRKGYKRICRTSCSAAPRWLRIQSNLRYIIVLCFVDWTKVCRLVKSSANELYLRLGNTVVTMLQRGNSWRPAGGGVNRVELVNGAARQLSRRVRCGMRSNQPLFLSTLHILTWRGESSEIVLHTWPVTQYVICRSWGLLLYTPPWRNPRYKKQNPVKVFFCCHFFYLTAVCEYHQAEVCETAMPWAQPGYIPPHSFTDTDPQIVLYHRVSLNCTHSFTPETCVIPYN